ncbi:MAG TPA: GNAT family N-acetyltransferase [Thermoplasmata archaeon]|nr:GNAT family N-acetyltransferase [Thermoplasmata archaeon]
MTGALPRIRPATPSDCPAWGRLRRALWPACTGHRNIEEMRAFLADPARQAALVAEGRKGVLVGFVEASLRPNYRWGPQPPLGYLEGLYVAPSGRRRGLGRVLVRTAEAWARSKGCREMGSDAHPTNRGSRAAHAAYGYRERERLVIFTKRLA